MRSVIFHYHPNQNSNDRRAQLVVVLLFLPSTSRTVKQHHVSSIFCVSQPSPRFPHPSINPLHNNPDAFDTIQATDCDCLLPSLPPSRTSFSFDCSLRNTKTNSQKITLFHLFLFPPFFSCPSFNLFFNQNKVLVTLNPAHSFPCCGKPPQKLLFFSSLQYYHFSKGVHNVQAFQSNTFKQNCPIAHLSQRDRNDAAHIKAFILSGFMFSERKRTYAHISFSSKRELEAVRPCYSFFQKKKKRCSPQLYSALFDATQRLNPSQKKVKRKKDR